MPQIAGLRGVLPDPARLKDVVAAESIDVAKGLADGALARDTGRAIYRYHQLVTLAGRTLVRKMFVCAVRIEPWTEGLIRPHEETLPAHKAAALAALTASKIAPPPVFAGYRDAAAEIERLFRKVDGERPTLEVTTADGTLHRLWRAQDAELFGQLRRVLAPKKLIVLDGHGRYEATLAYRDQLAAAQPLTMYSSANYAAMCLVNLDDPALTVAPRHRAIRGGATSAAALAAAKPYFIIEKIAGAAGNPAALRDALVETVAHQPGFAIAWAGEPDAWKLTLSPDTSPQAIGVQVHRALQKLDPYVVDRLFIERALPGAAVESFSDLGAAFAAKRDAVIAMRPLTVEQIQQVADLGQLLPAGSTAFPPRLATGLISSVVDPDEDVM